MVVCGRSWSFVVVRGRAWSCVVVRGRALSFMVVHGRVWSCVVVHGVAWSFVVVRGRSWSCVVVHANYFPASPEVPGTVVLLNRPRMQVRPTCLYKLCIHVGGCLQVSCGAPP